MFTDSNKYSLPVKCSSQNVFRVEQPVDKTVIYSISMKIEVALTDKTENNNTYIIEQKWAYEFICNCSLLFGIIYLVCRAWHNLSSLPCTETEAETETELDMELDMEPESETETEKEPSIYVNIRDFGLSTRIHSFVRVIFSVCLSV